MTRNRPQEKLRSSPLVLVLSQVRFSPLMAMSDYIPRIQDQLRLAGYPVNASGQYQQVSLGPSGLAATQRPHWEFLSKDRRVSVVVNEGFVVMQTSAYDSFEVFLSAVIQVLGVLVSVVQGLLVQRVGLRYVDLIRPGPNESWEDYVKEGLRGFSSSNFLEGSPLHLHQVVAKTETGTMIVRLLQNREMAILPPDFANQSLMFPHVAPPMPDELLTLIDIDHFTECEPIDCTHELITQMAWPLKNASYDVFRDNVITEHALKVWQ